MNTELENEFDSIGAYAGEAVMDLPPMASVAGILEPMVAGYPTSFDEDSGELTLTFTCTLRRCTLRR